MNENINRITVLLAVYNGDNINHFDESISSLINQKKYIYEILIIINGPIERKLNALIDEFKKNLPIKIVKYEKNLGISKALNLTLPLIKSEWIARLDSDDICDKNRFKNMNQIINKYGDQFDVFGTYIKEFSQQINDKNIIRKVPLKINFIKLFSVFSSPLNNVTTFYKKKLTIKDDNFYPLFDGFEDYGLWLKLIYKKIKIKNIPIVSVYVRIGNNMLGRRGGIKYIKNELKFRLHCVKYINNFYLFPYLIASILRVSTFLLPNSIKKYLYLFKRKFF